MPPQKMKVRNLPPNAVLMFEHLSECLDEWGQLIPKPSHTDLVDGWKNDMKHYVENLAEEDETVESIAAGLIEAYLSWNTDTLAEINSSDHTHSLMLRPQTTQRSNDWYTEFKRCLTASEIYKAFGSPLCRGTLVMQKAGKIEISGRNGPSVCYKDKMNPFDWGICFEPVVKLILEMEWDAMIHECGRFIHLKDPRFAASPDGLILRAKKYPEMAGHLLEIKCPKTRTIGIKIPMEYFYQMQLQMEVTEVRACEYVEAKFEFVNDPNAKPKRAGLIAVVGCFNDEASDWLPCKYVYGPVGDLTWKPDLGLNERTLELNMWKCDAFHHERVHRDEAWFGTLWPKLYEFWEDVEKAKKGEFILPESSRKKKETTCLIVDSDPETPVVKDVAASQETSSELPSQECLIIDDSP